MILYGFAPERKKALENARFTEFSRASSTFGFRKLHSHATAANLTFTLQARFDKQRCIASNYSSSASFGLDSLSFQPSVLRTICRISLFYKGFSYLSVIRTKLFILVLCHIRVYFSIII